ncbi:hypothetical protein P8C59_001059 [Phyllachora maydis]|uniref:Uncharacterized protein n=1 Tax=Phyllachora maydis TaxID=1825666 RepID=A0AAD9MBW1_9PEZI|nr:hypothetical protein P8C59_001059 [Phyllachora maydis]
MHCYRLPNEGLWLANFDMESLLTHREMESDEDSAIWGGSSNSRRADITASGVFGNPIDLSSDDDGDESATDTTDGANDAIEIEDHEEVDPDEGVGNPDETEEESDEHGGDDEDEDEDEDEDDEDEDGNGPQEQQPPISGECNHVDCVLERALEQARTDRLRTRLATNKLQHEQDLDKHRATIDRLKLSIEKLNEEVERLRRAREKGHRSSKKTWLQLFCGNTDNMDEDNGEIPYEKIYKRFCREENMSPLLHKTHPDIRLVRGLDTDEAEEPDEDEDEAELSGQDGTCPPGRRRRRRRRRRGPQTILLPSRFDFAGSPVAIQLCIMQRIFLDTMDFRGQLVHCFTRLHPFRRPQRTVVQEVDGTLKPNVPRRFILSSGLTHADLDQDGLEPKMVLAPLAVCRQWCFFFTHAFYGLNTFAFSSLGELGAFCAGIGPARLERVRHMELTWVGSQSLVSARYLEATPSGGEKERWMSLRTLPLAYLPEAKMLRSLVVHLDETGPTVIRRAYEPRPLMALGDGRTDGQPNGRMTRNLHTLQGLDHIHTLRGMCFVRFYDFHGARPAAHGRERSAVRDSSFSEMITRLTSQKVVPARDLTVRHGLRPLFAAAGGNPTVQSWLPDEEHFAFVESFYPQDPRPDGSDAWDSIRKRKDARMEESEDDAEMEDDALQVIEEEDTSESDDDDAGLPRDAPSDVPDDDMNENDNQPSPDLDMEMLDSADAYENAPAQDRDMGGTHTPIHTPTPLTGTNSDAGDSLFVPQTSACPARTPTPGSKSSQTATTSPAVAAPPRQTSGSSPRSGPPAAHRRLSALNPTRRGRQVGMGAAAQPRLISPQDVGMVFDLTGDDDGELDGRGCGAAAAAAVGVKAESESVAGGGGGEMR